MNSASDLSADQYPGRRIVALDIIRGIAIISIVVLHRLHYNWSAAGPGRAIGDNAAPWVLYVLFYLITMAGIFALITGTVTSLRAYQRNAGGRSSPIQLLYGGLATGLWILALHYAQRIFFANGFLEGRFPIGILLGWIRTGETVPLAPNLYYESNALSMIGSVVILVTLVLFLVLRSRKSRKLKRDIKLYIILGTLILIATPIVRYELGLYKSILTGNQDYFGLTLINLLTGGYGMFPFLAYGLYGAAIGAALTGSISPLKLKRVLLLCGLAFFLAGGVGFFILGGWDFNNIFANTLSNQFHWILFRLNQLGFFLILYWLFLSVIDFAASGRKERTLRFFYPARVFGMLSLTVFFSEPILAELLKKIWDPVFPGWNDHLLPVILFGLFCLIIWWFLLKLWWKTVRFAGSLEWLGAAAIRLLSGKKSTRFSFNFMNKQD
ncbi:MAG: hypothetical protein V2A67_07875 [Bacteroidota bacterium]